MQRYEEEDKILFFFFFFESPSINRRRSRRHSRAMSPMNTSERKGVNALFEAKERKEKKRNKNTHFSFSCRSILLSCDEEVEKRMETQKEVAKAPKDEIQENENSTSRSVTAQKVSTWWN